MPGKIVTPEEWRSARLDLLAQEKAHTRKGDELTKLRSEMPMVKITKDYEFTGPGGKVTLSDIFDGRRQLLVYHMMFDPTWENPCSSCGFAVDQMPKHPAHLNARDTTLVLVSRAPIEKITAFQKRIGWDHFDWYSSYRSDFNYDFHVTNDASVCPPEFNYSGQAELEAKGVGFFASGEQPGMSVFFKEGDDVCHSYSAYGRGFDHLLTTYKLLDLTPLGRGDNVGGAAGTGLGFKFHDEY